ncbi:MAG: type II toxin-antitoxin system RelE family toxin [Chthoniobacterales bacterium]
MEIEYTEPALHDLRRIPKRFARQIVAKVSRLEHGLHGDIKRLTNFDCDYRLRCGDYRVLFDLEKQTVIVHRVLHRREAYD